MPQNSDCKFLCEQTEATATCMFLYKSTSYHEFYGGYGHVHGTSTSCRRIDEAYGHVHALSTSRHDL
jgi:hypothetical protein